jgi:hypothetical protein
VTGRSSKNNIDDMSAVSDSTHSDDSGSSVSLLLSAIVQNGDSNGEDLMHGHVYENTDKSVSTEI